MPSQDTFEPKVSFVIPNYNSAVSLGLCLDAISAQIYPKDKVEILVVDNGSIDASHEVALAKGVKLIIDKESHVSGLRNRGAAETNGELIVFVDSDCILHANWLKIAIEYLQDNSIGMVGSKTHVLPEASGWIEKAWKVHLDFSSSEQNPSWIVTRSLAVKRVAFDKVNGFDESLETCEDVAFGHELSNHFKIKNVKELAPVHLEDASDVKTFFKKEVWRGLGSVRTSFNFFKERDFSKGMVPVFKESLSLLLPFYFLFASLNLFLSLFFEKCFVFFFMMLSFPLLFISIVVCAKTSRFDAFFKLFALYYLYVFARVWSLLVSIWRK